MAKLNLDVVQKSRFVPDLYGNRDLDEKDQMYLMVRDLPPMEQAALRALAMANEDQQKITSEMEKAIRASFISVHNACCNGPDGAEVEIKDLDTLLAKVSGKIYSAWFVYLLSPVEEKELKKSGARSSG
jgi:hypothetical protein